MLYSSIAISSILRRNVLFNSDEAPIDGNKMTISTLDQINDTGLIRQRCLEKNVDTIIITGDEIIELYSFENIDTLKTIKITATKVTEIPENCFKNCRKLATVELSENIIKLGNSCFEGTNLTTIDLSHIQTIGEFAFRYCHSLDKIKLNQSELGAGLFMDTGLTEVELGSGVTQIQTGCFMYCANLQTITIPNTVQVIGERAFVYCTKLTKVNFADKSTLQQIGDAAFGNTNISEIALPRSLKQIGDNAFEHVLFADLKLENFDALTVGKEAFAHNELLKTVTIGDNVTLTNGAFKGCNILETVTFGSKKVRLDDNLFYECFKLKEVKGTFETVGQATFYRCSSLEKFNLVNVSSIGGEAFWLCAKLEVDFPNQTMSIGDSAFAYCDKVVIKTIYQGYTIGSSAFMGCLGITELKFYSSNFGAQAFEGCEKLKSVDVTAIEGSYAVPNNAFAYCFALETLKINDKLTQIGNLAFYKTKVTGEIELFSTVIGSFAFGETLITKLTLSSVPQMGSAPFMNCKHLKTLVLNSTDRDSLSLSPFIGCEQLYDYNIKSAKDLSHDNGVFFDSMKLTLYAFGSKATEFEFPPLVMKISADAFVLSRQLKTVNISHYVELPAGLFENCLNLTTFNYTANDNKLKNSLPARLLFNCTNLKKVVLSTQITELGEYCFAKCTSLTDIDLSNVIKIGGNCFVACTALTSVKIDNVEELGEYAFSDTGLKSVVYPPKLILVVSNVFNNAKKLSKVTFGKNLMTLDAGCFAYSGISKLTIPATVMSVDPTVFDTADVSLKVEKNSVFFTVSGNCLIDKYSGNLVLTFGKLSKTYTIPKDVKKIGANSIRPWIEAATVGKTTLYQKSIGTTVIKIPASVVSIDPTAFNADTYLYTVCYDGFVYSQSSPEASNPILTNAYVTDKYPYGDLLGKAALKSCSTKVPGELNARHIIGLSVAEIVLIVIVVLLIILFVVGFIIIRMKLPKAGDKTVFQPIS
ncbi:surface antigen BspA-like [Trichomonas vaginalis G3]|uniref:Surface antigen BspA-like n=1 Tax=Trichomonas vaginalis (strain ATCC PRA-98 / G3) TaxID=412133 RepID=A2D9Y0_TRIV3|nr:surface antigen family [Trichomonas vaginalis G3]EAY22628.1 surface antigen BspA-like [Trichomonas vaginalis G3]KAI5525442.1 surface antigen family [Trichomonas vaginalis G3]|eukprot:XP_001583614.1 surface antigen BspA-like [Trichomonas vaginalis G3]